MLILSREGWYSTNSGWIDRWYDNKQFSTNIYSTNHSRTTLNVEDTYRCAAGDKVNLVRQNLLKASEAYGGAAPDWFITFCSYTGPNGIGTPNAVTGYVDPHVINILKETISCVQRVYCFSTLQAGGTTDSPTSPSNSTILPHRRSSSGNKLGQVNTPAEPCVIPPRVGTAS